MKRCLFLLLCLAAPAFGAAPDDLSRIPDVTAPKVYDQADAPTDARVDDLIRRLSLAEKIGQMMNGAKEINRLGVPAYDYWNESLHGVARAGVATVFPQAIGMAATWDVPLLHEIGQTISTEGRAKYNDAIAHGKHGRFQGLTFWTPNINIFRDPRWGRGQETYGEDPFLTGRLAVAFITGMQGDDPRYARAIACAKHFAVHSGPEPLRHVFNATPSDQDLHDTYLPQFEAAVREGHVGIVMGAYNDLYNEPCCANHWLLTDVLRGKWGFQGHVVSDCNAVTDIYKNHKEVATAEEAAAVAIKAGCDLECGTTFTALANAVGIGLITEKELDRALHHVLATRFRLGMFDPPERVPYSTIGIEQNDSPEHAALALRTAHESLVLLKNDHGALPLDLSKLKHLAVLGENADSVPMLLGNYNGTPSHPVTILAGIRAAAQAAGVEVQAAPGCPLVIPGPGGLDEAAPAVQDALRIARDADAIIYVGGISPRLEGEEMRVNMEGFHGGDRTQIELPKGQTRFLQLLQETGKPVLFVNCSGSAVAFPWEAEHLPAILQAWYPGQAGGTAVADVLFGKANPSGRLPVTFYRSTADLPAFEEYGMANRTYRYFGGQALYPFGHGLSYTTFQYETVRAEQAGGLVKVRVKVTNRGSRDGDEVVQVYARRPQPAAGQQPVRWLAATQRVSLKAGAAAEVELEVTPRALRRWDAAAKDYKIAPGDYQFEVGASSADIRGTAPLAVKL